MTRSLFPQLIFAVVALTWIGNLGRLSAAPPDARKYAVTDIAKVDDDFAYQGEYVGRLYEPRYGHLYVGLQIVARGDGNFDAVLYEGGLPGAGWNMEKKTELSGTLRDGTLTLEGEGRNVTTDSLSATVYDSSGSRLGYMQEIHRVSPTVGMRPPRRAIVLFDGESTEN